MSWSVFIGRHCELMAMGEIADHQSDEFQKYLKERYSSALTNNTNLSIRDTLE